MAIYHLSAQIIGRSGGKSAVASAAYRAGEKIQDQHIGQTFDYTKKQGVDYTEILTPSNAPEWASDRSKLWNEVEKIEKSKNSQLSRELNIALPKELGKDQQIELIRNFAKEQFVAKGMVADLCMHNLAGENPHAHIMLTVRPFNEDKTWGAKAKKEYMLDDNGEKIRLKSGEFKSRKIDSTDWNKKETLEDWRKEWAEQTNKALEKAGVQERIDHRSLKDQGERNRVPQKHIGAHAHAMEQREELTELGTNNRDTKEINEEIKEYRKDNAVYKQERKQNDEELKAITNAPISEPTSKIVQQPRTIEQVKQELKLARAEVNETYENMNYQTQIVGNLKTELKTANSDLEKYNHLTGEIGRVENELGEISRFNLMRRTDIKDLKNERNRYVREKQIFFGGTDQEGLTQKVSKLEQRLQPENKKLDGLEKQHKQSRRKFDQVNTEAQGLGIGKDHTMGKSFAREKPSNQKNRATGQPVQDTIKALGNSLEKVKQEEKFKGERMKQKLDREMQDPQKGRGKGKSQGWGPDDDDDD